MTKQEQFADAAVAVSVATFLGITLKDWNHIVHLVAGLVAIVAGLFAIAFHWKKIRLMKKE
jgi:hypothetical protein